jgi:hypothetical protein
MSDKQQRSDERPIFSAFVGNVVEFIDDVDCNMRGQVPMGSVMPPGIILSTKVDQFIEFADTAAPLPLSRRPPT